jgi:uncharacterized protein YkwD
MKKALLLVILMTFSVWANSALAIFSDVPLHHPNAKAINFVREEGIVNGYPDGTFKPEQSINRAEFTKIIIEAVLGQAPLEHAGECFPDVNSEDWFYPYVCYAKRMEIISGFPDKTFRPGQNISFAEAAKIVANSFHMQAGLGEPWYQPYIEALEEKNAVPPTLLDPSEFLTRGEMAEIIYRIIGSDQFKEDNEFAELKQEVIELTNVERQKAGLPPLTYNAYLESSAQVHADDMQQRDYFEHDTPEGKTPTERIKSSGYLNEYDQCNCNKSYAVGENLGKGQVSAAEAVETWMNSPEHKANILNAKFSEIGIGISEITVQNNGNFLGYFWVQNFGDVQMEK